MDSVNQTESRRDFPRLNESLAVRYEFVGWDETEITPGSAAVASTAVDISAAGLGLADVPTLTVALKAKLLSGHRKARLEITLADGHRLYLFARLIWAGLSGSAPLEGRAGFHFLDISPVT